VERGILARRRPVARRGVGLTCGGGLPMFMWPRVALPRAAGEVRELLMH
jgi:hypothetical protein